MDNAMQDLPQPNFAHAANNLRTVAEQLLLCDNLPSVDGGAQLLAMMQTLLDHGTRLERKVDGLDRRMTITNRNTGARQWNQSATQSDDRLAPLFSFETGEPLNRCPLTVEELESLHASDVDRLLRHLDEPVDGCVDLRMRRLKVAFGVTTRLTRV